MGYKSKSFLFEDLLGDPEPRQTETIHESELAKLLGITRQQLSDKARSGILKRVAPATYALPDAVRDYCGHLRTIASRNGGTPAADEQKRERTRLAKEQADATALKNAQLRSELVPAAEVKREWQSVLRDIRAAILAVPSRYGSTLPHLSAHDVQALTAEIKSSLEGLAGGND